MVVDRDTFADLSVHLERAAAALWRTANHLAILSSSSPGSEQHWAAVLDELLAMTMRMGKMQDVLTALMEANRQEDPSLRVLESGRRFPPP